MLVVLLDFTISVLKSTATKLAISRSSGFTHDVVLQALAKIKMHGARKTSLCSIAVLYLFFRPSQLSRGSVRQSGSRSSLARRRAKRQGTNKVVHAV